jgi:hypothetical protein
MTKRKLLESLELFVVDTPEWKHSILKFVASILYIKNAKYVLVIHNIKPPVE